MSMSQGGQMIRAEYTIDGKSWFHLSINFQSKKEALDYLKKNNYDAWICQVRFLVIFETDLMDLSKIRNLK